MTDLRSLFSALARHEVRYVLVGGAAATVHGSTRLTQDIDIVYDRSRDNLERLAAALAPTDPYLRDLPPGLPFRLDKETLLNGLNFTLVTKFGSIDLLGEIPGDGTYDSLLPHSFQVNVFGCTVTCLDLPTLIEVKRAAGRPKDLEAIAELEKILEATEGGAP